LDIFFPSIEEPRHDFPFRIVCLNVPSFIVLSHSLVISVGYFFDSSINLILSESLRPHKFFKVHYFSISFPMIDSDISSVIVLITKSQLIVLFLPPEESNPKSPIGHFSDASLHFLMTWVAKESHLLILHESSFSLSFVNVSHNGTQSIHGCTMCIMMMDSFGSRNRKNVLERILKNFKPHHFLKSMQTIIQFSINMIVTFQSL